MGRAAASRTTAKETPNARLDLVVIRCLPALQLRRRQGHFGALPGLCLEHARVTMPVCGTVGFGIHVCLRLPVDDDREHAELAATQLGVDAAGAFYQRKQAVTVVMGPL